MIFTSQSSIASILRPTPDRVKTIFLQNPRSMGQEGAQPRGRIISCGIALISAGKQLLPVPH